MAVSAAKSEYGVSVPKAAVAGGAAIALGAGLPYGMHKLTKGRMAKFDPRLLGMGVATAAGAAALAVTQPKSEGAAQAIGGGTGLAAGALAGVYAARAFSDGGTLPAKLYCGLLGGMWGGVMGMAAVGMVKD